MCGPRGSVDDDAGINQDQGDFQTVVEGIFKGLRVSTTLAVSEAAQTPFRCAQAALIEGSGSLIGFIRTFKDKYLPACSPQLLRFGAHLVLYMKGCVKTLGWEEMQAPEEAEDDILEAYTVHLISQRQVRPAVSLARHLFSSNVLLLYDVAAYTRHTLAARCILLGCSHYSRIVNVTNSHPSNFSPICLSPPPFLPYLSSPLPLRTMQANIIPYYAQHLPRSRRIDLYSKFLQTVEKKDERTKCLEEATRFFAEDIPDILQTTAQLSREHPPEVIGQRIDLDPSKVPEGAYHGVSGWGGRRC